MSAISRAHSLVGYNPEGRPENDFYPTPPRGTRALLGVEKFEGTIWECACGNGMMSRVLESSGYTVVSTDLEPRNYGEQLDFLYADKLLAQNIVTNPPFKLSQQFATRALSLGCRKLALLNKIQFIEGVERCEWLETTPLRMIWQFKRRLKMTRNGDEGEIKGGGMMMFAWFVWERDYKGRPMVGWI